VNINGHRHGHSVVIRRKSIEAGKISHIGPSYTKVKGAFTTLGKQTYLQKFKKRSTVPRTARFRVGELAKSSLPNKEKFIIKKRSRKYIKNMEERLKKLPK
jgi:hypothetical protein